MRMKEISIIFKCLKQLISASERAQKCGMNGDVIMWKWEAIGQPRAVAVIFHSAYEHHAWYAWLIEKLRHEGFHVVTGDLPGHGEEYKYLRQHNEDFADYYRFAKQLMEVAMNESLPVFVIGNGLGALLAVRTIIRNQFEVAGIILSSPWMQLKLHPGKLPKTFMTISAFPSSMKLKHDLSFEDITSNIEAQLEMKDDIPFNTLVTVKWYNELQSLMKLLKTYNEVCLPNIPVLLMTGGADRIIDANATVQWLFAQKLTFFQYREWKQANHNLYLEIERDDVFKMTKDFMNSASRMLGYITE